MLCCNFRLYFPTIDHLTSQLENATLFVSPQYHALISSKMTPRSLTRYIHLYLSDSSDRLTINAFA